MARADARRPPSPRDKRYISSQAYLHAMRAEIAALAGEGSNAAEELQLALVYDPESIYLALELARASRALGQTGKAKKLVARVLERQPAHLEALLLSGQIAAEGDQLADAERAFRKAVSVAPDDMRGVLGVAAILERRGRIREAVRVLERGAERAPQSTEALAALAKLEKADRSWGPAARALERAMTRDPHDTELMLELSDALERLGRPEDAAVRWRAFVEAHPQEPVALLEAARAELRLDRDDAAGEYLERLEASSSSIETQRRIGFMLLSEGRNERAAEVLREVVREKPDDWCRHALAIALNRIGRDEEALAELEHIGPESDLYDDARVSMAEILMREGKLERSEIALRNGLEKKSGSAPMLGLLAQLIERKGDVDGAVVLLREAPGDVSTRRKLAGVEASILARHGRKDEARRLMSALTVDGDREGRLLLASFLWDVEEKRRAIETLSKLTGSDAEAETLNFLGYAYAEEGRNLDEAEELVRRALGIEPRSAAVIDSYGWVLFRRGRLTEAEHALRRASRLAPRDPEIAEHMGDVMRALGNHKGARAVYQRAIELVRGRIRAREPGATQDRDRLRAKLEQR